MTFIILESERRKGFKIYLIRNTTQMGLQSKQSMSLKHLAVLWHLAWSSLTEEEVLERGITGLLLLLLKDAPILRFYVL